MREIKFRAWDKTINEMISWIYLLNGYNLRNVFMRPEMCGLELMQYTGLKDKTHLKDIVFGDVVIVDSPKGPFRAKITQEVGALGIVVIDGQIIDYFEDNWNDDFMALLDLYWNFNNDDNVIEEIEVIGNIYENPELLEVQNG